MLRSLLLSIAVFCFIGTFAQAPTTGLLAYWPFTGNYNNAGPANVTAAGVGTSLTTGYANTPNTAVQCAGNVNSYVNFTDDGSVDFAGSANFTTTFGFFFNGNSTGGLIDNCLNYGGWGVWLWSTVPGTWNLQFNYKNASVGSAATTNFSLNAWHHVAAVRNNGTISLYIDGVLRLSGSEGSTAPSYPLNMISGAFSFAGFSPPRYNPLNGKVDEIRIYNRALTALEIQQTSDEFFNAVTCTPPTMNTMADQLVCNNSSTAAINFSGSDPLATYNWTNNNPSIGLAASGSGNIASFTATNATNAPVTATITVTPTSAGSTPVTQTFSYTGAVQTWTVPPGVTSINVDASGAAGMANTNNDAIGGKGGRVQATLTVVPGEVLQIKVGQGGNVSATGGYNGGANGGTTGCALATGGGGGGSSDILRTPYNLADRILVAGGGGGAGGARRAGCGPGSGGGGGGGYYGGGGGGGYRGTAGAGGSQVGGGAGGILGFTGGVDGSPGSSGLGGAGGGTITNNQTADEPGTNGGDGGNTTGATGTSSTTWTGGGGGGGSSYTISGATGVIHTQGYQSGNGQVVISYVTACDGPSQTFTITVNPTPTVNTVSNQVLCNGTSTAAVNFSGAVAGTSYNWTNNTPSIGLAASGTGNIASFTATNASNAPVTATITVTPTTGSAFSADQSQLTGNTCMANFAQTGLAQSFRPVANSICGARIFLTSGIGSGTGNITIQLYTNLPNAGGVLMAQGTVNGIGAGQWAQVSWPSIAVTPATTYYLVFTSTNSSLCVSGNTGNPYPNGQVYANAGYGSFPTFDYTFETFICGVLCTGAPTTFTYTVNPTPTAIATPAAQTICTGSAITTIALTGNVTGAVYNWTRDNNATVTGIAASGSGNISGLLTNTTNAPVTVTFTITPSYTNAGTTCTGTAITATVVVNPTPNAVATPASQTTCSASAISSIALSGNVAGTVYNWTRDNNATVTGIAASGVGNINGTLTNTTNTPVTVTFTITPSYTNAGTTCTGTAITATVVVNPIPNAVATPASQTICSGSAITTIALTGNVAGTVYNWTRDNTGSVTGIAASGSGNISGSLTNTTTTPVTVTFTVTPSYTNAGTTCTGTPVTATVTVNPIPDVNQPANQVVCNNGATAPVNFTGSVAGTIFNWTNNTPSIGLAASGTGNIPTFVGTNATNAPVVATVTVTPSFTSGGGGPITQTFNYTGALQTFTVPPGITNIRVDARGAQGGSITIACAATGGLGARMTGDIAVTPGEVITILVGGQGQTQGEDGGGGGGSFVVRTGNVPLVVAGGGGGATNNIQICAGLRNGVDASITTSGTASANGLVAGGTAGNGGGANVGSGCGGGGFFTDGGFSANPNGRGRAFVNGGDGGTGQNNNHGGYGGGGCGWYNGGNGGGGGGYSGGGTDGNYPSTYFGGGGGGGSFNSGTNQVNTAGVQTGNGLVTITYAAGTTCTGTPKAFTYTVNPTVTVNAVANQVVCNNAATTAVNFSSPTTGGTIVYNWTNNNTSIGLAAAGMGNIASFTATNSGTAPVTATITVTPSYTNAGVTCVGTPITFTITVNPTATVNAVANQVVCNNASTTAVNFTSPTTGGTIVYNWTNNTTSIGLAASGTGNIASFTATNATNAPVTATITVTPSYTNGGTTCTGTPMIFTITVNPVPQVNQPANQVICNNTSFLPTNFTTPTSGGVVLYSWTNNNAAIGLGASGTGNIPAFTGTNATNAPEVATITVTPSIITEGSPALAAYPLETGLAEATGNFGNVLLQGNPTAPTAPSAGNPLCQNGIYIGSANGQNVITPNISTLNPASFTLSVDFRVSAFGSQPVIMGGNSFRWIGIYMSGSNIGMKWNNSNTAFSGTTVNLNQWYNAKIIFTNNTAYLLLDGNLIQTQATGVLNTGNNHNFTTNDFSTGRAFNGCIRNLVISGNQTCAGGTPKTFTYTVNPTATINPVANQVLCNGANSAAVNFTSPTTGGTIVYNWTNSNAAIGLGASGTGNLPVFVATNTGNAPISGTITVTPTYTNGAVTCNGTPLTFTITVNPPPVVNPVANQVVCNGAPTANISFTTPVSGGTAVYNWTNNTPSIGLPAAGTGDILSFNAINTGNAPVVATITVTLSYTNGGVTCVSLPVTFTITVNPTPTVNQPANQTVCANTPTAPVNFTGAVAGTVYNWTNNAPSIGLAASGTGDIPSFTALNATNVPVIATIVVTPSYTNAGVTCTGASKTFTITVNPVPTLAPVANKAYCTGATTLVIPFNGTSGNLPGTVYNWTNSTPAIGLPASGTGDIAPFVTTNATNGPLVATIVVTPVGPSGCVGTPVTFTITVNPTPVVNPVAGQVLCNGSPTAPINFTSPTTGPTGALSFQWTNSAPSIGLAANGTGNIPSFIATNTGLSPVTALITVTPVYTNAGITCTGTSQTFTIVVNPTPTVNPVTSQAVCAGSNTAAVSFTGSVFGTIYNWTNNNTSIGLAASGAGNIASFTAINATNVPQVATITVTPNFSNGVTCPGTPITFTITVNPNPTVNPPASQVVCAGATVTQTFTGPVAGTVYNWTNSNTAIGLAASGTGNLNFTATNATGAPLTGTITVTPTFTNGGTTCTGAPQTFSITVNPVPNVNAVGPQVLCNGANTAAVNFTGNVPGTVYSWTNTNTSIGLAASGTGNIASFTATNATNVPQTATITVTPSYTNGATTCTGTPITFTITVNPTPAVNTIANQTVCSGAATTAVTIAGPVAGTVYNWTNNNTSIGLGASGSNTIPSFTAVNAGSTPVTATITVTPSFTNAGITCSGPSSTFTITVNPTANVNQPANQLLCNGSGTAAVNFTGTVAGTVYSWTNNNTAIGLAAAGTGNIPSFTATNNTAAPITATITVTPSSASGCTGIPVSFTITVNPTPSVNAIANQAVCDGATTAAVTLSGPVAGTVYTWSNSNPSIGLGPNGTGNIPAFTANNPTNTPRVATITVTPSYTNGGVTCTGTPVSFTITVNPLPNIVFLNVPPRVCLTDTIVTLTATPGGTWTGPGISGNTFSAAAAGVGVHRVTYTATNGFGCTSTRFANIVVNDCKERHNIFQEAIRIWPNPNNGRFSLQFNSDKYKEFQVKVVDSKGREMAAYKFSNLVFGQILPFDLSRLAGGTYFVYVYNTQESGVFPVVIVR